MLVIKVELWPFGNKDESEVLGEMRIINDGGGTGDSGDYEVRILNKRPKVPYSSVFISGYPRLKYIFWELIRRSLNEVKKKNANFSLWE